MRHPILIPILIALFTLGAGAASNATTVQQEGVVVTFNAGFTPRDLPRDRPAPVSVEVKGKVRTADGSHPPALRNLEIELNRNGHLDSDGLAVCRASTLQSTSTRTALARCRRARVGSGSFHAVVTLDREIETSGEIVAFNSRLQGREALLLHLFAGIPVRFTLVVPLKIGHRKEGEFGTVLRAKIPKLAGGLGSVTEIELAVGRRYSSHGERRSYVSAACGAPAHLAGALFHFARASFRFEDHRQINPPALLEGCSVR